MWNLLEGKGSELSVLALFLIFIITLAASCLKWGWPWTWGRGKKRSLDTVRNNPGEKPGNAAVCKEHMIALAKIEIKVKGICDNIKKIERQLENLK